MQDNKLLIKYLQQIMENNKKRVYCFGGKTAEGNGTMRELLGGKGANLAVAHGAASLARPAFFKRDERRLAPVLRKRGDERCDKDGQRNSHRFGNVAAVKEKNDIHPKRKKQYLYHGIGEI